MFWCCKRLVYNPSNNPQNLGIQNEMAIGVTPDPFPPPKTQEKAVWARDYGTSICKIPTISFVENSGISAKPMVVFCYDSVKCNRQIEF